MKEQKELQYDIIGFGEVMLRLSPPNQEKLENSHSLQVCAGGGELNVAAGVARLGLRAGFITKLPTHPLGSFIRNQMRICKVDDSLVVEAGQNARVGTYYYQKGGFPRKPAVVYDRKFSAFNSILTEEIPHRIFEETRLFHVSGITLALGGAPRDTAIEMMKKMKEAGAQISFDVNFRATLWSEEEAREVITGILPLVDILFVSEESSRRMFRKTGELKDILKSYCKEYGVSVVATTSRKVQSATSQSFGSLLYAVKTDSFYEEPPYENIEIVDRIGSGDAYVSGVLFGLLQDGDYERAVSFGNAAAALKCTIEGDLPSLDFAEASRIIAAHKSAGPQSEMDR